MNPKEKANQLYWKIRNEMPVLDCNVRSKKLALIFVDEVLSLSNPDDVIDELWWEQVRKEIISL
jgi:hypothetical protein